MTWSVDNDSINAGSSAIDWRLFEEGNSAWHLLHRLLISDKCDYLPEQIEVYSRHLQSQLSPAKSIMEHDLRNKGSQRATPLLDMFHCIPN